MSKNVNRNKLKKANNNREYNIILKNIDLYCYICVRRAGNHNATCAPISERGRRGQYASLFREYRNWKYNRKTKWK